MEDEIIKYLNTLKPGDKVFLDMNAKIFSKSESTTEVFSNGYGFYKRHTPYQSTYRIDLYSKREDIERETYSNSDIDLSYYFYADEIIIKSKNVQLNLFEKY